MSEHLDAIADVIRDAAGLRLEQSRHHALRAALARAWPGVPHAEVLRRALDPVTGPDTIATLIDEVTIKETSFLRDRRQLASIDWHGLRSRARDAGSDVVRVWSVACATGEEPYSLALLACEAFSSSTPPVRILATDVSSAALAFAAAGRYRVRSAQSVEEPLRSRYLERDGDQLVVAPALRALVTLTPHNLVRDAYPPPGESPFHLILCRNVLIYFDTANVRARGRGSRAGARARRAPRARRGGRALRARPRSGRAASPALESEARHAARRARTARGTARSCASRSLRAPPKDDLMNPEVHYLHGLEELESGDAAAAVSSLRRVLYLDPGFELAAFALGRAHEKAGEPDAARRRYEQALRMLGVRPAPGERLAGPIDAATVIDACEARLVAIQEGRP